MSDTYLCAVALRAADASKTPDNRPLGGRDVDANGINSGLLRCPRCFSRLLSRCGELQQLHGTAEGGQTKWSKVSAIPFHEGAAAWDLNATGVTSVCWKKPLARTSTWGRVSIGVRPSYVHRYEMRCSFPLHPPINADTTLSSDADHHNR